MTSRERKMARGRGMLRVWSRQYVRDVRRQAEPLPPELAEVLRASVERARAAQQGR